MISREQIQTDVRRQPDGRIYVTATITISHGVGLDPADPDEFHAAEVARHNAQNLVLGEMYGSLIGPVGELYSEVMKLTGNDDQKRRVHQQFQALANLINCRVMSVTELVLK